MTIETELKARKKKTIGISELKSILGTVSDEETYAPISDAVSAGILCPVKSSGTNGNRVYPLYLKYKATVNKEHPDVRPEIATLHPVIIKNGYLGTKPEEYLAYQDPIRKLNRYLFGPEPTVSVSKKERSFAIFGEEKQLDDSAFLGFLGRLGITLETLRCYETPEYCFNDYIPARKPRMTLLICENKDIWFNIRRRMFEEGADTIFDTPIDGVVYGCGNKVSEAKALSGYTRFLGTEKVRYLYWGDIDRAGLQIYLSLRKNNPELEILLFSRAYMEMLRLAETHSIPDSTDHRALSVEYDAVYAQFPEKEKTMLSEALRQNKRIPQEIISYETLLKVMR